VVVVLVLLLLVVVLVLLLVVVLLSSHLEPSRSLRPVPSFARTDWSPLARPIPVVAREKLSHRKIKNRKGCGSVKCTTRCLEPWWNQPAKKASAHEITYKEGSGFTSRTRCLESWWNQPAEKASEHEITYKEGSGFISRTRFWIHCGLRSALCLFSRALCLFSWPTCLFCWATCLFSRVCLLGDRPGTISEALTYGLRPNKAPAVVAVWT